MREFLRRFFGLGWSKPAPEPRPSADLEELIDRAVREALAEGAD